MFFSGFQFSIQLSSDRTTIESFYTLNSITDGFFPIPFLPSVSSSSRSCSAFRNYLCRLRMQLFVVVVFIESSGEHRGKIPETLSVSGVAWVWCCFLCSPAVRFVHFSHSLPTPKFQYQEKRETRTKAEELCVPCNPIMGHSASPSPSLLRSFSFARFAWSMFNKRRRKKNEKKIL